MDGEYVLSLTFTNDSKTIVCASPERTRLVDRASGRELRTIKVRQWPIAILADGLTLVGQQAYRLLLWDVQTGKALHDRPGENFTPEAVALSPDGRFTATAEWIDHEVSLWDAATGRRLRLLELKGEGRYVRNLAFTGDGGNVAACQYKGFLQCWDAVTGKEVKAVQLAGVNKPGVFYYPKFHISADGQQVSAASDPRATKVPVFAWEPGTPIAASC